MLTNTKDYFAGVNDLAFDKSGRASLADLKIAACVLLVHAALIDRSYPHCEWETIIKAMIKHFGVDRVEAVMFAELAEIVRKNKDKVLGFLEELNTYYDVHQKKIVYALVWKVIKADNVVHPQELAMVSALGQQLQLTLDQEIEARKMVMEDQV
jgi:uncharacterized tellurite resistance protein B-like protein